MSTSSKVCQKSPVAQFTGWDVAHGTALGPVGRPALLAAVGPLIRPVRQLRLAGKSPASCQDTAWALSTNAGS